MTSKKIIDDFLAKKFTIKSVNFTGRTFKHLKNNRNNLDISNIYNLEHTIMETYRGTGLNYNALISGIKSERDKRVKKKLIKEKQQLQKEIKELKIQLVDCETQLVDCETQLVDCETQLVASKNTIEKLKIYFSDGTRKRKTSE